MWTFSSSLFVSAVCLCNKLVPSWFVAFCDFSLDVAAHFMVLRLAGICLFLTEIHYNYILIIGHYWFLLPLMFHISMWICNLKSHFVLPFFGNVSVFARHKSYFSHVMLLLFLSYCAKFCQHIWIGLFRLISPSPKDFTHILKLFTFANKYLSFGTWNIDCLKLGHFIFAGRDQFNLTDV
jgi:hypothetical protein